MSHQFNFRRFGHRVLMALALFSAAPAFAGETINVGVPSAAAAASPGHPYRPGLEREVLVKACAFLKNVRCVAKELPTYPGPKTAEEIKAAGLDAVLNETVAKVGPRADKVGLVDAVQELAESGELSRLRRHYLDAKREWGVPLTVGVSASDEAKVKSLCAAIKAQCTVTRMDNAKELYKQYDSGKFDWVAGTMGWQFRDKSLENRVNIAQDPTGAGAH